MDILGASSSEAFSIFGYCESYYSLIIFRDLFANHQKMLYTKKRLEQTIKHYYTKSKNQKTKESYL